VDEEQLVRLVARGDRAAFAELHRRTSPWLAVRLRRRCGGDELVAEVARGPRMPARRWLPGWQAEGVTIEDHTLTHPVMSRLPRDLTTALDAIRRAHLTVGRLPSYLEAHAASQ
jgi:hypothetical protein